MNNQINALALPLQQYDEKVQEAIRHSKPEATLGAYKPDLKLFAQWCDQHELIPLPASPQTVCRYLAEMAATKKVSTMQRVMVSISQAHKTAQLQPPTAHISVRATMAGFRRTKGVKRTKKVPLLATDLKKIFMTMDEPDHALAVRDRALLLVGFAGAFRRSELAAMRLEDIRFTDEGMVINISRSETDQEGEGRNVAIYRAGALCAVRALQAWLKLSGITTGKIWRVVHWSGAIHPTRTPGKQ